MYLCENMCREMIARAHRGQRLYIELEVGMSHSGVGIQLEPSARQYMFWVHEPSLDQTCFQSDGKWGPTAKVVVLWLLHVSMDRIHRNPDPPHSHFLSPPPSCPHHGLRRDQTTDLVPWVLCWRHTVREKPYLWIYPGYQDILISPFGVRDIMKESLCQKHSWIPGWSRKYQL